MRRRWPLLLLAAIALLTGALMLATLRASRPLFDDRLAPGSPAALEIAPLEEAGIGEPFVFPKRVAPTSFASPVVLADTRHLDYEVELAFVLLRDLRSATDAPGMMGLLLCNDFTDRWTLVRGMAGGGEIGTRGFADAKGKKGFLPVGPFFPEERGRWLHC